MIDKNNLAQKDIVNALTNGSGEGTDLKIKNEMVKSIDKRIKQDSVYESLSKKDIDALKLHAASPHGLLDDDMRRKIWPMFLDITYYEAKPKPTPEEIEAHPHYNQVVMDVRRSLRRFPPSIEEDRKLAMLDELVLLIMRILIKHSDLHYYQGFHDICVTFLLVLGEELAYLVLEKLATTHFKVYMEETMEETIDILSNIYIILEKEDKDLMVFMEKSEVGVLFGLSWLITWFGHVLNTYEDVVRLFDMFIVSHPWFPLYLVTAIVLARREDIMKAECDMASIHSLLNDLPDNLNIEALILKANQLFEDCPPKYLLKEQKKLLDKTGQKISHRWYFNKAAKSKNPSTSSFFRVTSFMEINRWTVALTAVAAFLISAYVYHNYNNNK